MPALARTPHPRYTHQLPNNDSEYTQHIKTQKRKVSVYSFNSAAPLSFFVHIMPSQLRFVQ